ncbi:FAD-binding domain-containing protein [Microthyrium microscopicum]|uniref:Delta(24)-sterol reductase n=1 Tax=Microthyrium microscopicum TaxID=703497 RepID=A0A6A6UHT9_9PEZI|nr:FAD-binding domain-containing protein [Microthyrium microscopicum]
MNDQDAIAKHSRLTLAVSEQIKGFHDSGKQFRIYHGSTNSTRSDSTRHADSSVSLVELKNILSIDKEKLIVSAEPNVPFDALLKATLAQGLVPPVVPEFPGITVGGAFAGSAGESSSFKYGFVDATVERIECILGDGAPREVGREDELFKAAAGTLGTIAVVTRLDIRLVKAEDYVELRYHLVTSFDDAVGTIVREGGPTSSNDFLDTIMYSPTKGAVITGRMVDKSHTNKQQITRFTRRHDPWFYVHAEKMISNPPKPSKSTPKASPPSPSSSDSDNLRQPAIDYVPLTDYLFRYDRGGFWVGRFGFTYFSLPFIAPLRYIMDKYLHTREMFHALHVSNQQQLYIVEDVAVPIPRAPGFLADLHSDLGIYPLWLCPLRFQETGLKIKHFPADTDTLLNVGVWGAVPKGKDYTGANRELEKRVRDCDGVKWLYAQMFYSEEEFWSIYDREAYEALREKFGATKSLPSVFDKIKQPPKKLEKKGIKGKVVGFWVFPGLYGLYKVWRGKDYIIERKQKTR